MMFAGLVASRGQNGSCAIPVLDAASEKNNKKHKFQRWSDVSWSIPCRRRVLEGKGDTFPRVTWCKLHCFNGHFLSLFDNSSS
jgi:hypothetical protein